jgi:hypothetical protein
MSTQPTAPRPNPLEALQNRVPNRGKLPPKHPKPATPPSAPAEEAKGLELVPDPREVESLDPTEAPPTETLKDSPAEVSPVEAPGAGQDSAPLTESPKGSPADEPVEVDGTEEVDSPADDEPKGSADEPGRQDEESEPAPAPAKKTAVPRKAAAKKAAVQPPTGTSARRASMRIKKAQRSQRSPETAFDYEVEVPAGGLTEIGPFTKVNLELDITDLFVAESKRLMRQRPTAYRKKDGTPVQRISPNMLMRLSLLATREVIPHLEGRDEQELWASLIGLLQEQYSKTDPTE